MHYGPADEAERWHHAMRLLRQTAHRLLVALDVLEEVAHRAELLLARGHHACTQPMPAHISGPLDPDELVGADAVGTREMTSTVQKGINAPYAPEFR